jgi:hypothetical protein
MIDYAIENEEAQDRVEEFRIDWDHLPLEISI